jgi:protein-S-isoprenylcysteine O-methyltransferase Ste14
LPLIEELTRSGEWLFRWRSYLPLAFVSLALASAATYGPPVGLAGARVFWDFACLGVSLVGLGIRVWTVGHTPRGTSGRGTRGQQAETLNTTGLYSVTRHPLYLGNFVMGLGVALFPLLWWLALVFVLAYWLYYERIMLAEEAFLRARFGDAYLSWADRTPAFVPALGRYEPAGLPFSPRNVLRREYNGAFALVVVMALLDAAGVWRTEGDAGIHTRWVWMLAATAVFWALAITVKRGTTWLEVDGR